MFCTSETLLNQKTGKTQMRRLGFLNLSLKTRVVQLSTSLTKPLVMSKKKSTLQQLRVSSFATGLEKEELENAKGGAAFVRGRRFTFRVRWTTVDTRVEMSEANTDNGNK